MGKGEETVVTEPEEIRKAPYRVPEDEGFFAPHDPVEGAIPPDAGPPDAPAEQSEDERKAVP
jgi:hypothetical protein